MFGSHLSIAGSMTNALHEAAALGLDCVQVFTKNQQQWKAPPLKREAIDEWAAELKKLGWNTGARVVSHASYLANLASPNDTLRANSIALMREEIDRCETLGIPLLVFHPGAFTTSTLDEGLARIAAGCATLLTDTRGYRTVLCLENVAGQGSTIGRRFEELAELRSRIISSSDQENRIGFCIDTCHAHAAGYDLSTRATAQAALEELDAIVGLKHVRCLHLNDSKGALASRIDRHQHIGEGTIGLAGFAAVINHPALTALPKIMETPKGDTKGTAWDTINVARLRSLLGSTATSFLLTDRIDAAPPKASKTIPAPSAKTPKSGKSVHKKSTSPRTSRTSKKPRTSS